MTNDDDDKPADGNKPPEEGMSSTGTGAEGYQVGRGKPPKHSRFRQGQSGNLTGRPKDSLNFSTLIERELKEKVTINENGVRKSISKRQAIVKRLINNAVTGDHKAIPILLKDDCHREEIAAAMPGPSKPMPAEDAKVMASIVQRIRNSEPLPSVEPEPVTEPDPKAPTDPSPSTPPPPPTSPPEGDAT